MTILFFWLAGAAALGVVVRLVGWRWVIVAVIAYDAGARVWLAIGPNPGKHTPRKVTEAKRQEARRRADAAAREAVAAYERLGDTQAWEAVSAS